MRTAKAGVRFGEAPERGLKPSPKSRWFVAAGLAGAVFVVAAVALSAWSYLRYTRARHVRTDSLPRIRTLIANDRRVAAYDLTVAALRNAPEDQDLQQLSQEILTRLNLTTTPPGARISYRDYGDVRRTLAGNRCDADQECSSSSCVLALPSGTAGPATSSNWRR